MRVLAFDSSSNQLSLALVEDQKILNQTIIAESNQQSQLLVVEIEKLLRQNNIWYQDLDLVTTIQGPGSFTGVRIGLSVAKTIHVATNLPIILINALEAIYYPHRHSNQEVFVAIDAGIEEIFIASFKENQEITKSQLIKLEDVERFLPQNSFLLCGSGKDLVSEIAGGKNIAFTIKENSLVNCAELAFLALEKYHSQKTSVNQQAVYLRAPNITQRKK